MATTDRASVFETIQIGKETVSGTAVTPTRKLGSLSIDPTYKVETSQFRPKGYKFDTVSSLNKEWSEASVDGVASYNELQYPFAGIFGNVTPSTPGGATLSRLWTFGINTSSPDTPATYTIEAGSSVRASRATHLTFTEFGMSISRSGDGVTVSGSAIMQKLLDDKIRYVTVTGVAGTFTITVGANTTTALAFNASPAAVDTALELLASVGTGNVVVGGVAGAYTLDFSQGALANTAIPTITTVGTGGATSTISRTATGAVEEAILPILPTQIEVKVADTAAGLSSGTLLTRLLSLDFNISDRFGPIWTIDKNVASWADKVELDPSSEVKFMVGADDAGMGFLNTLRTGATKFIRISAIGDLIETGYNYSLTVDLAVKITDIGDLSDEDGLVATEFTCVMTHDATWQKAISVALQNKATAL